MQFKIAKILNTVLIVITLIIVALAVGFYFIQESFPEFKTAYLIISVVIALALLWTFKWLESRWDKKIITKMAQNGKIALINIESYERVLNMRDSSFAKYWLYSFTGAMLTPDLNVTPDIKFYEKMHESTGEIPRGTLFITYDEEKPSQIFIIPNVLVSHLPELMPLVQKMEKSKKLDIKYLNAYYSRGMVVKTFKETMEEERHALAHRKLEAEKAAREQAEKAAKKEKKK